MKKKTVSWRKITGIVLLIALILSLVYSAVNIVVSVTGKAAHQDYERGVSDYVLMLFQCILGLVVMSIPSFLERKWRIDIPNYMYIMYFIFLFCAIYLGEVRRFYYVIPYWDIILHAFSGAMLGALGFTLVSIFNDAMKVKLSLSPGFVAFFAFCFALASGAVWEIYEFVMDGIIRTNMQKFLLADGSALVGRAALADTMEDLIVDCLSALVVTATGYLVLKNRARRSAKREAGQQKQDEVELAVEEQENDTGESNS